MTLQLAFFDLVPFEKDKAALLNEVAMSLSGLVSSI